MSRIYSTLNSMIHRAQKYKQPLFAGLLMFSLSLAACGADSEVGVTAEKKNAENASGLSLQWKYLTDGRIVFPPVAMGDKIFVASEDNHVYALDQTSGARAWDFEVPEKMWGETLAAGEGIVYIASLGGALYALDAGSGARLWKYEIGVNTVEHPVVKDGKLYVYTVYHWFGAGSDKDGKAKLIVLDAASGEFQWEFESDNFNLAPPYVDDDTIYLGGIFKGPSIWQGDHLRLYALDLKSCERGSCEILWTHESEDGFIKTIYAYGGVVSYLPYRDFVRGVDASTGELLWSYPTENWVDELGYSDSVLYFGSANDKVHAVDIYTGQLVWAYSTPPLPFNAVVKAPVVQGGALIFQTKVDHKVSALNIESDALLWSSDTDVGDNTSAPVVSGDMVFLASWDGNLYAYKML